MTRFTKLLAVAGIGLLIGPSLPPLAAGGEDNPRGFVAGHYTGASQLMIIGRDGVVTYDDTPLAICHVEVIDDDILKAAFPDKTLGRGKSHIVTLRRSTNKPRQAWTTVMQGDMYKVTAIPYSPDAYVLRVEISTAGKLVAGAQQFYALEPK